jgi:hypothetical protein
MAVQLNARTSSPFGARPRDGILAAAISELEREDPEYKKSFAELYGSSLDAMAENRLKPVVVPSTFDPED